jgi:hypothetical protein
VLRDALQERVSQLPRLVGCGRKLISGAAALTAAPNAAGWRGIATCGSVHVCPVCAPAIRRVRAAELNAAGGAWETVDPEQGTARGLVMVTLTMRHYARQSLSLLVQRQREAWKKSFGQNALRTTKQIRRDLGIVGYVRAWETTHGPNGWHVHFHVAVFLDERPDAHKVRVMERLIYRAWADALESVGAYRPTAAHGVRVDAPGLGEAGKLAQYLMKSPDGRAWTAAQEMVRGDVKVGRKGHRAPFEIARNAVDGDQDEVELWREYEEQATGIRSLYWSHGLRALLAELVELDEREDVAVAADENAPGKPIALFPPRTWYGHVVRHPGRRLQLVHAAERWSVSGVRTLVQSWGLLWGVDVLEPDDLPPGAKPTLDEVLQKQHRAWLSGRADAWRREYDRQDREERLGRVIYMPDAWEARRVAQEAADEKRAKEISAAPERERIFREALRRAKRRRPAGELENAMVRFRSTE